MVFIIYPCTPLNRFRALILGQVFDETAFKEFPVDYPKYDGELKNHNETADLREGCQQGLWGSGDLEQVILEAQLLKFRSGVMERGVLKLKAIYAVVVDEYPITVGDPSKVDNAPIFHIVDHRHGDYARVLLTPGYRPMLGEIPLVLEEEACEHCGPQLDVLGCIVYLVRKPVVHPFVVLVESWK